MSNLRTIYTATYSYPGVFFPEETSREVSAPTIEAAVKAGPREDGYFSADGWYAVSIRSRTEKRFVADDGQEAWVVQGKPQQVGRWVLGERVHADDVPATDENRILIANLRANSPTAEGVRTRCGNWQPVMAGDTVVPA